MNLYYRDIIHNIQNSKTEFQQIKLLMTQLERMSKEMSNLKSRNHFLEDQIKMIKLNESQFINNSQSNISNTIN